MFNKLKSLLVVLMLVLIGACADFDDNGGSGGSGGGDQSQSLSTMYDLGYSFTIPSLDSKVFGKNSSSLVDYDVIGVSSAGKLRDTIIDELELAIKKELDKKQHIIRYDLGVGNNDGAGTNSGSVSSGEVLVIKFPIEITAVSDSSKTDSDVYSFSIEFDTPDVWDGQRAVKPTISDGYYLVESAENLAWLDKQESLSENIKFMNSVNMGNHPLTGIDDFSGIIDGNGKKIYNLSIGDGTQNDIGLVNILRDGSIKNLTITSGTIKGVNNVGAFVGIAATGSTITITDVKNGATVTGGGGSHGGLIGRSLATTVTVSRSSNTGQVTGKVWNYAYYGGLIGKNDGDAAIDNSSNSGAVTVVNAGFVGGLVGHSFGHLTISDSSNTQNLGGRSIGGLVGIIDKRTKLKIDNSSNSGDIEGTGGRVGGLVGASNNGADTASKGSVSIHNSTNSGKMSSTGMTGGLIGESVNLTIDNGSNTGNLEADSGSTGGLVGTINEGTVSIKNSRNKGNITGVGSNTGGIVGESLYFSTLTIDNCSSVGTISIEVESLGSDGESIGGIVGRSYNSILLIKNALHDGSITGTGYDADNVGGIIGYSSRNLHITNSVNNGSLNAQNSVGGLVGNGGSNTKIDNSSNTGDVEGSGRSIAGLIGDTNNEFTIDNSSNVGNILGMGIVGGIIGSSSKTHGGNPMTVTLNNVHSYAKSIVSNDGVVGGIISGVFNTDLTVEIKNSYWLYDSSTNDALGTLEAHGKSGVNQGNNGGIVDMNTESGKLDMLEFEEYTSFWSWDFHPDTGIWLTGGEYPTIRNQPVVTQ